VVIAIHRAIEQEAAAHGEMPAYVDDTRTLTYRELNGRANALARALIASGFKRGSLAVVRMPRSADLVVVLLAVLKAGGAYMWIGGEDASWPGGLSIVNSTVGNGPSIAVDLRRLLQEHWQPSPNLPILTRGSDVACVLRDRDSSPAVLVPHATITALSQPHVPRDVEWSGDEGTLDLWLALMRGATATAVEAPAVRTAAA
jgi:non-ribosomal peptide synthetase component F